MSQVDRSIAASDENDVNLRTALRHVDRRVLASLITYLARDAHAVEDPWDRATLEHQAFVLIRDHPERGSVEDVPDDLLLAMMSRGAGQPVSADYLALAREQMGIEGTAELKPENIPADFSVAVIGGGLSGILAAVTLKKMGFERFTVFDKNPNPGGVWETNTYPGARVDTPSMLYSYSFLPQPEEGWPDYFSALPAVRAYLRTISCEAEGHFLTDTEVTQLAWQEDSRCWDVRYVTSEENTKTQKFNVVIGAFAMFHHPSIPAITGQDDFEGDAFHSSQWPETYDVAGKRVALIGSGASANQILPAIADTAASVTVFQRTPHWITTHRLRGRVLDAGDQQFMQTVPAYRSLLRWQQFWEWGDYLLEDLKIDPNWPDQDKSVNEFNESMRVRLNQYIQEKLDGRPDLISKVTPDYPPFSKRMIIDNGWYEALKKDNVSLISDRIARIDATSIATDETSIDVDVIIYATGFVADQVLWPIQINGSNSVDIRQRMNETPEGYRGYSLADCPNMFLMWGPNSVPGHGGAGTMTAEIHMRYIAESLKKMLDSGWTRIEVKDSAVRAWNEALDVDIEPMIWNSGVSNWFKGSRKRAVSLRPHRIVDMWNESRHPNFEDYIGS
ncbi:MAG: monooxygenase [Gordonia sp.]|nr:monooxygenase [Gordonia sp. (in: high G+C Gram-positive bacteria)]